MVTGKQRDFRLPVPVQKGNLSFEEALAQGKSIRSFLSHPITRIQLSSLLWAVQGISDTSLKTRTAPSAGATYPLEVFVACGDDGVEEMRDGVYSYIPETHSLTMHCEGDIREQLVEAALQQYFIGEVPVDIIICAIYERTLMRYGGRGERYVHMEAGHAGQNLYKIGREIPHSLLRG